MQKNLLSQEILKIIVPSNYHSNAIGQKKNKANKFNERNYISIRKIRNEIIKN